MKLSTHFTGFRLPSSSNSATQLFRWIFQNCYSSRQSNYLCSHFSVVIDPSETSVIQNTRWDRFPAKPELWVVGEPRIEVRVLSDHLVTASIDLRCKCARITTSHVWHMILSRGILSNRLRLRVRREVLGLRMQPTNPRKCSTGSEILRVLHSIGSRDLDDKILLRPRCAQCLF